MKTDIIDLALGKRLEDASLGHAIIWENQDIPPGQSTPYLIYEFVPTGRRDRSLAGGSVQASGFLQITVVTAKGNFATEGRRIAEEVAAVFDRADPQKRQITQDGVTIIMGDSAVQRSYPDGANWRTPLQVKFTARKA